MFAFFVAAFYAASYGCLSVVVFTEILRVGEHGFEKLKRHYLLSVEVDFVDTGHADILNDAQVCQIFLSESHPKAGTFYRWIVFDERFQLFVV